MGAYQKIGQGIAPAAAPGSEGRGRSSKSHPPSHRADASRTARKTTRVGRPRCDRCYGSVDAGRHRRRLDPPRRSRPVTAHERGRTQRHGQRRRQRSVDSWPDHDVHTAASLGHPSMDGTTVTDETPRIGSAPQPWWRLPPPVVPLHPTGHHSRPPPSMSISGGGPVAKGNNHW